MKTCSKCRIEKPLDDFHKNAKGKLGRDQACKPCRLAMNEAYAQRCKASARPVVETRRCPRCATTKPADGFYKNSRTPDGLSSYCKACHADRGREEKYGLPAGEFDRMYEEQGGKCLVCAESEAQVVDHCHAGGGVRGLLCTQCNVGLGMFRDRPDLLERAIAYLDRK